MTLTSKERLQVACALVRKERAEAGILKPVHGITLGKLQCCVDKLAVAYRQTQDFETNRKAIVEKTFPYNEEAQAVARQVLGHYFSWRRHGRLPDGAINMARKMKLILV